MKYQMPFSSLLNPGHSSCAGCGEILAMRHVLDAAGPNTIIVNATGCSEVTTSKFPASSFKVPWIHANFENASAVAAGVLAALGYKQKNERTKKPKNDAKIMAWGGDGAFFDIGFGLLSGSWERGENILHVCFDNEAYMNCLSFDSFILTEHGYKKVGNLLIGEKIFAYNQNNDGLVLKRCTKLFFNGIKPIYELCTRHRSIKATANHPFLVVQRAGRESKLVWKALADINIGEEVIVLKNFIAGRSFYFPKIKLSQLGDFKVGKIRPVVIPQKSSPELMEFLGLFVGDGWVRRHRAEVGFSLPTGTKGHKRLTTLARQMFDCRIFVRNKNETYLYSINIVKFISSLGFGCGAKNKIVPDWVFTLPLVEKQAFLKGLMMSDGYQIGQSCRYVSASMDLLRSLRLLLQSMGYRVGKIHLQKKEKGTFVVYRRLLEDSTYGYICFSEKKLPDITKYLSQIKQRDYLADNQYFGSEQVIVKQFLQKEPTLDLCVDGEHNFIADGFVVHNTGVQASGATPYGANTTTTPPDTDSFGNQLMKKDMLAIALAHCCVYAATATIGNIIDVENKVKKALSLIGPKYLQILTTCVPGWYMDAKDTIKAAHLAQQTGLYPVVEFVNGKLTDAIKCPSPRPKVEKYLKLQGRYKHLFKTDNGQSEIKKIQLIADKNVKKFNLQ